MWVFRWFWFLNNMNTIFYLSMYTLGRIMKTTKHFNLFLPSCWPYTRRLWYESEGKWKASRNPLTSRQFTELLVTNYNFAKSGGSCRVTNCNYIPFEIIFCHAPVPTLETPRTPRRGWMSEAVDNVHITICLSRK